MNCLDWEERIALEAGGDLPATEVSAVEQHLAACSECRAFRDALSGNLELLRQAHQAPIAEAQLAAVRARVMAEVTRPPRWRWVWLGGLAAAAVTAMLLVALRPARVVELPHVAVCVPPAPAPPVLRPLPRGGGSVAARFPSRDRKGAVLASASEPEPLVVKMITTDPDVVIYWIADRTADRTGDTDR